MSAATIRVRRLAPVHWAIAALLVTALWHLGQASAIHVKAWLAQYLIRAAWERSLATSTAVKPWSWADTWPVARLIAPGHDADLHVLAGDSGRSLAFGPGHRFGTPAPGAEGNTVVSAHRDTHFAFLRDVAIGEVIDVQSRDGRWRRYIVTATQVVHKSALRLLADEGRAQLTLVTCWPFDALEVRGPMRYVVTAVAHERGDG